MMRHKSFPRFESLEERKLLSHMHVAHAHARLSANTPVVLNGSLTVDNKAATQMMNSDGSITTSTPVSGQVGALGQVHGTWNTTDDQYGDYEGPDTMQLRGAKGTVVIAFSDGTAGTITHNANGSLSHLHPQIFDAGTKAFARGAESGTISLTTNPAHTAIVSMALATTTK